MRFSLSLATVLALVMPAAAQTVASADEIIAAERTAMQADCDQIAFSEGFIKQVNVNGDGREDLFVDFHAAQCNESSGIFCGSGGCEMDVYLQDEAGTFTRIAELFGYTVDFDRPIANPPSFIVAVHGNFCDESGMSPCSIRYKIENGALVEVERISPSTPN